MKKGMFLQGFENDPSYSIVTPELPVRVQERLGVIWRNLPPAVSIYGARKPIGTALLDLQREVREMCDAHPENIEILGLLGEVYKRAGNIVMAMTIWRGAYDQVMVLLQMTPPGTKLFWGALGNQPFHQLTYDLLSEHMAMAKNFSIDPNASAAVRMHYESALALMLTMLRLNPNDNHAIRDEIALPCMTLNRPETLAEIYKWHYTDSEDEESSSPAGAAALHAAWAAACMGRKAQSVKLLTQAVREHPVRVAALLFDAIEPSGLDPEGREGYIGNSYHEAHIYHHKFSRFWRAEPKAMAALEKVRPLLNNAIIRMLRMWDFSPSFFPPASFMTALGIPKHLIPPLRDRNAPRKADADWPPLD